MVESAAITKPGTIIAFEGVHQQGKTNDDVEGVRFENTVVEYFPVGIDKIFPRLNSILIRNCGLKTITQTDLACFVYLKSLNLSENKLTTLPNDLFKNMFNLQWIFLQENLIEYMSSKLLLQIKNNSFEWISFSGNKKIDESYKKSTHNTLEALMAAIDKKCSPPNLALTDLADVLRSLDKPPEAWLDKQEQLLKTGKHSDFTIKVHGKEYKVHKNILSAQSSVFDKMFDDGLKEQNLKQVEDFTEKAFEEFLAYLYTLKVKSAENASGLFVLAVAFDVADLKQICEGLILGSLDESNLREVYNLGYTHSSEVLKKAAFVEIKKFFPELDDRSIDDTELINNLMKTKRQLEEYRELAAQKFQ